MIPVERKPTSKNQDPADQVETRVEASENIEEDAPSNTEIAHFLECVQGQKAPLVSPEETVTVQRIIDAIYRSSSAKAEVALGKG